MVLKWLHLVKTTLEFIVQFSFVETPRKLIIAKLSIGKLDGTISTDEDPSLRIESFAIINLRGISTDPNPFANIVSQTLNCLYISLDLPVSAWNHTLGGRLWISSLWMIIFLALFASISVILSLNRKN